MAVIRRLLYIPVVTLVLLLLASSHPMPVWATTPIVGTYEPAFSATGVPIDTDIRFRALTNASERLDPSTLSSNFTVFDVTSMSQVPGSIELSSYNVYFLPFRQLEYGHTYRVSICNDIRNELGERLYFLGIDASDGRRYTVTWEFTTVKYTSASPFTDVSADSQYAVAIAYLYQNGVVSGYGDGRYGPKDPVNRAQFAKLICGALGLDVVEGLGSEFNDLGPNDPTSLYPHDYITAMANREITRGTAPGVFSPWREISRAQVVTLVCRGGLIQSAYEDVPILKDYPDSYRGTLGNFDPTHANAMRVAEYNGLLDGLAGFGPDWDPWKPMTREEISQVLYNLMVFLAS